MDMLTDFLNDFNNVLSALKAWWPVLAVATFLEILKPGKKSHWPTILSNIIYLPLGLAIGATALSSVIPFLEAYIPTDILQARKWAHTPIRQILLWIAYIAFFDFLYYWLHRAQHQIPFLWRYHMVHHSDVNTSATTVGRHHWLEEGFRFFIITAPLIFLMGGTKNMPLWVAILMSLNGIFMHWNVSFRFGMLEKIIITPAYHRIHHSIEEHHYDRNFGVFTQMWDRIFLTRHLPSPEEFPVTGISGLSHIRSWALLLPWPIVLSERKSIPREAVKPHEAID